MDHKQAWQTVLGQLKNGMLNGFYQKFVVDTIALSESDGQFIVGVKDAYTRTWLEGRLTSSAARKLEGVYGKSMSIKFVVLDLTTDEGGAKHQDGKIVIDLEATTRYEQEVNPKLILSFPGYALRLLAQGDLSPLEMSLWVGARQACYRVSRSGGSATATKNIAYNDIIGMVNMSKTAYFRVIRDQDDIAAGMVKRVPEPAEVCTGNAHIDNANRWAVSMSPRLTRRDAVVIESILLDHVEIARTEEAREEIVLDTLASMSKRSTTELLESVKINIVPRNAPANVLTILRRVLGVEEDISRELFEAAEVLQNKLIKAFGTVIVKHHFLKVTAPTLKLTQAKMWAIIALRHRRYYDHESGEEFDYLFAKNGIHTLAEWAGTSRRSITRWLDDPIFSVFIRKLEVEHIPDDKCETTEWERRGGEVYVAREDEPPLWFEGEKELVPHWANRVMALGKSGIEPEIWANRVMALGKSGHAFGQIGSCLNRLIKTHLKPLTTMGPQTFQKVPSKPSRKVPLKKTPTIAPTYEPSPDEEKYRELIQAMESISGSINMATANFLDDLLLDWNEYLEKLHPQHPDKKVDAYAAVLEAIKTGIENAKDARPNHGYIRKILTNWAMYGFKKRSPEYERRQAGKVRAKTTRASKQKSQPNTQDLREELLALIAEEDAKNGNS